MCEGRFFTIAGPRMDALAERFAGAMEAGERTKWDPVFAASDVAPEEMVGLMLRSSIAAMSSAIAVANTSLGIPLADMRAFAIAAFDHHLNGETSDVGR